MSGIPFRRFVSILGGMRYLVWSLLFGASLWLTWYVRDMPLESAIWNGLLRVDSLSAFFVLVTLLVVLGKLARHTDAPRKLFLTTLALLLAYVTSSLVVVVVGYFIATIVDVWSSILSRVSLTVTTAAKEQHSRRRNLLRTWRSFAYSPRAIAYAQSIWALLPCLCLWLAFSALWTVSKTWRYTAPVAGGALHSFTFGLVLLATLLGVATRARGIVSRSTTPTATLAPPGFLLALAWFYPLIRLYSLGGWNLGWHLATILIAGAVTLWAAWQALTTSSGQRLSWLIQVQFGLALTGVGLGTSAGLAAGCYALIVATLLAFGLAHPDRRRTQHARPSTPRYSVHPRWALWLLSGAIPLTAPFVSAWFGIGSAVAGGIITLAGVHWFAMLLATLAVAHHASMDDAARFDTRLFVAAGLSVVCGVASPTIVQFLLRPIVRQLQGGLTLFGDVVLWPWGGLLALDSARQEVAALPSLTIVGLMLILGALTWLLLRLHAVVRER